MTDYDSRQFNLMIEKVNAFEEKAINLSHLVSSLDGLQSALKGVNKQWRNSFLKQWGVLEDVHAEILDRNLKEIPDEYMSLIKGALGEIRRLIAEKT
jgi:hypothetical protein